MEVEAQGDDSSLREATKRKRASMVGKKKKNLVPVANKKQKGLGNEGQRYPPPAKDIFSIACTKMKEWHVMKKCMDTQPRLNSAVPITSQAKNLDAIKFMVVKHFPGHKNLDKWTKPDGTIGEVCLRFLKDVSDKLV